MSPSRGFPRLFPAIAPRFLNPSFRRTLTTFPALVASRVPLQVYISTSHSPFLNLSIEHHLFQTTPEKSTVLFLYTNAPSIVIGRNQNPWVEVNLPLLHKPDGPNISLVRRRSGGGTVYHDLGNVNYSVCMPSPVFDRDTHAEMVVRALHGLGVCSATVNTRHDIVLLPDGMVAAQTKMEAGTPEGTRKISGSAYKMTRLRSYHHGTMLLDSRLEDVRSYLRSPARGWLKARGVDSVRSPVANVGVGTEVFVDAVVREFGRMYLRGEKKMEVLDKAMDKQKNDPEPGEMGIGVCYVGEEALEVGQIRKGVEELKVQSPEWIYGQTPQLTLSVPPPEGGGGSLTDCEGALQPSENLDISLTADKGIIQSIDVAAHHHPALSGLVGKKFDGGAINDHISESGCARMGIEAIDIAGSWIESVLGRTSWGR